MTARGAVAIPGTVTRLASGGLLRSDERALLGSAGVVFALASGGAAMSAAAADAMFLSEVGPGHLGEAVALSSALLAVVLAVVGGLADRLERRRVLASLAAIVSFNRLDNLVNIKPPTICISGEHDKNAAPFVMEKMAARIPGAEYLCLKGAGHIANMEKPAEFNAAVLDFLRRHFPQE